MLLKNSQSAVSRTIEKHPREPVLLAVRRVVRKPACKRGPWDWNKLRGVADTAGEQRAGKPRGRMAAVVPDRAPTVCQGKWGSRDGFLSQGGSRERQ